MIVYHYSDIQNLQMGIGVLFGTFVHWMSIFMAGYAIGFIYSWKLTLVIISVTPFMAGSVVIKSKVTSVIRLFM